MRQGRVQHDNIMVRQSKPFEGMIWFYVLTWYHTEEQHCWYGKLRESK